jgi:hypothetical protein
MMDRRRRADLEGAQALGRLSDEMVFSLGRAVREPNGLADDDLASFAHAAELFELLASDDKAVPDRPDGMMFSAGGYLDALHVVQDRADEGQIEEYAGRLAQVLRNVIAHRSVSDEDGPVLESLRDLFAEVGEATLSRAGDLSLPREAHWPTPLRQAI